MKPLTKAITASLLATGLLLLLTGEPFNDMGSWFAGTLIATATLFYFYTAKYFKFHKDGIALCGLGVVIGSIVDTFVRTNIFLIPVVLGLSVGIYITLRSENPSQPILALSHQRFWKILEIFQLTAAYICFISLQSSLESFFGPNPSNNTNLIPDNLVSNLPLSVGLFLTLYLFIILPLLYLITWIKRLSNTGQYRKSEEIPLHGK